MSVYLGIVQVFKKKIEMLNSVAGRGFSEMVPWAGRQRCQIHVLVFALS